ncbi:MAG TPA: nicotinate (nicotinamide) nucleotide adenylyltransferase [Bacteroidetes bacterium]|nr:putative nicotinate-nucleotide adenylyltransferase [bacterium BMS3Bbin04]HDO64935.1 nicotinate (nicotinamide) nucleotide adenylyltransferase [Bacteroidota bacterium]HEX04060.1 nicotinate (nicotinamide) nucleotide adenylyltransferase [Bacteroidota bacterium]
MSRPVPTGLFGGTFDPPTIAHLLIAEWVRDELDLAQVWLMPAWTNPLKQGRSAADAEIRLRMLQKSFSGHDGFVVRDDEIQRHETSYTIDTLRALQSQYPQRKFTLILGSDSVLSLPQWKDYAEILERVEIAAVVRPGWDLKDLSPDMREKISVVEIPLLPISSTLVRERIAAGKSSRFLVPEAAHRLIEEHQLYR